MFNRKCGKNKNKGFTLIELLVVVIIIGILASVLLISVRSAILKARDGRIIAALGQIRTQAEIYFDNQPSPTYAGLNTDSTVGAAVTDITNNGGNVQWGRCDVNGYVVWSRLASNNNQVFCVDGTGKAGKRLLSGLTAGNCTPIGGASSNCGL